MRTLRFGLGSKDGPQAGYWKLRAAANRPDLYVSHNSRPFFHASAHASRDHWHVKIRRAPDQEPEVLTRFESSRVGQYERVFELVTPIACLGDLASAKTDRSVRWIPPPLDAPAVVFDVFKDPLNTPDDAWPGKNRMGTQLVGRIAMSTGQTACVVWRMLQEAWEVQMHPDHYRDLAMRAGQGGYAGLAIAASLEGPVHIRQVEELTGNHFGDEPPA